MDTLTKSQRSHCMSQIKRRGTTPETIFRTHLRKNGFRNYRMDAKIPGRADIYFPKKQIAVFIDGCFWHKCPNCFIKPKSNKEYWNSKIRRNVLRDKEINSLLRKQKIKTVRFWEHEIKRNLDKCYNKFNKIYEKTN